MSTQRIAKLLAIARDQAGTPEGDNAALAAGKLMAKTEGFDPEALAKAPTIRFDTPWQQHLMREFSVLLARTRNAVPAFARAERLELEVSRCSASMVVAGAFAIAYWLWPTEALGGLLVGSSGLLVVIGALNIIQHARAMFTRRASFVFETIVQSVESCDKLIDRGIRR